MRERNLGEPEIDALSEEELVRYFQAHRDDPVVFGQQGRKIDPQEIKHVFRLEIDLAELAELFEVASQQGIDLSDFIRTAALDRARSVKSS